MSVCPAGHSSSADDYCDVCGMPIEAPAAAGSGPAAPPPPTDAPADAQTSGPDGAAADAAGLGPGGDGQPCPNCGTPNQAEALFCENCGYDFTTGSMPRSVQPETPEAAPAPSATTEQAPTEHVPTDVEAPSFSSVVEVWIDPAWYEAQDSPDPLPSPGLPEVVALRRNSVLVGRRSASRNIDPDIDCGTDSGVSRRQAQLTTDGRRWFVEDLDSANGTFIGSASGALPTDPIAVGTKYELDADDRIYVGAWTRLVIRDATEEELTSLP